MRETNRTQGKKRNKAQKGTDHDETKSIERAYGRTVGPRETKERKREIMDVQHGSVVVGSVEHSASSRWSPQQAGAARRFPRQGCAPPGAREGGAASGRAGVLVIHLSASSAFLQKN